MLVTPQVYSCQDLLRGQGVCSSMTRGLFAQGRSRFVVAADLDSGCCLVQVVEASGDGNGIEDPGGTVAFKVMLRKGGKDDKTRSVQVCTPAQNLLRATLCDCCCPPIWNRRVCYKKLLQGARSF